MAEVLESSRIWPRARSRIAAAPPLAAPMHDCRRRCSVRPDIAHPSDRIERKVFLPAARARVWRAIANAREFERWFGMEIAGDFAPGARLRAKIRPTEIDAEVAEEQRAHEGMAFELIVERVEPERVFAFRWRPNPAAGEAVTPDPPTLVTFELDDASGGVALTITESGFDRLSAERRGQARTGNEQGWAKQARVIQEYLARS
jgi:uncharacterized protein YndB with AHSA1/START domain